MSRYNNKNSFHYKNSPEYVEKCFLIFLEDPSIKIQFIPMSRGVGKTTILRHLSNKYKIDLFANLINTTRAKLHRELQNVFPQVCLIDETNVTLNLKDRMETIKALEEWYNYQKFFGLYTPN